MIKKSATFSLFVFMATVAGVVIIGLVSLGGSNGQAIIGSNTDGVSQVGNITGVSPSTIDLVLSPAELAKHNSGTSCWLLISGKIYDVTTYLNQHPGNANSILSTCGTDATAAYDTKGKTNGSSHSGNAEALLTNYFIGNLNQTLKLKSGTTATATNTTPSTGSGQATQTKPKPISTPVVAPTPAITQTPTPTVTPTPPIVAQNTTLALTSAELIKHNSDGDCWLLISGKIYDVTAYINSHPGGANEILSTCGTDATAAYASRGGTGTHSSSANADLAAYYIGDLNQTVATNPSTPTTPAIANPTAQTTRPRSRGEDDD